MKDGKRSAGKAEREKVNDDPYDEVEGKRLSLCLLRTHSNDYPIISLNLLCFSYLSICILSSNGP